MTGLLSTLLPVVVTTGLVLSGALVVLSGAAYARRPRRATLLVVLAFATLCADSLVAVLTLEGLLSHEVHHFVEHVLVVGQAVLVLAAVYDARTVERTRSSDLDEPR